MSENQKTDKQIGPPNVLPDSAQMLEFVLANGLPLHRNGQYRYHGVSEPIWWPTQLEAISAAIDDSHIQKPTRGSGGSTH